MSHQENYVSIRSGAIQSRDRSDGSAPVAQAWPSAPNAATRITPDGECGWTTCQCSRVTHRSLVSSVELLAVKLSIQIEGGQKDVTELLTLVGLDPHLSDPALSALERSVRPTAGT